jgi:hypothetical protein
MYYNRIFGPKKYEVKGEWRKLHNEELHNLYSYPNIIMQIKSRSMKWAGHVASMEEERKVYKVLVRKPDRKIPLRRLRNRWEGWGAWSGFNWLRINTGGGLS